VFIAAALAATTPAHSAAPAGSPPAPQLHVRGNALVDSHGRPIAVHGVNRSGGEFACVQGNGIWDGPMDQQSVDAIKAWNVNVVRIPLNEACWNAESYVDPAFSGANYRDAVRQYVALLNRNGLAAIVELHWSDGTYTGSSSGCPSAQAICQKPMPDAAQSIPFWRSVARTFKHNKSVVFDLFNEAYPDRALPTSDAAWRCWRDGGNACAGGIDYPVAGMQSLVHTVRSTGARNVILLTGLAYSNNLTGWLQYRPHDPAHNLAAAWHSYNFNACVTEACWNQQIAPVIARVPLIVGELGENDCAGGYIGPLLSWLDQHRTSYLAWTWNTWDCSSGPALISNHDGTPTPYGAAYRTHLQSLTP